MMINQCGEASLISTKRKKKKEWPLSTISVVFRKIIFLIRGKREISIALYFFVLFVVAGDGTYAA